jgi:hypothetical protein
MILKSPILFFILLLPCITFCQVNDSLVKRSDLFYKNSEEKKAFEEMKSLNTDELTRLLLIAYDKDNTYPDSKAIQQINDCVEALKTETATKLDVKKVKFVYDYVHKRFLKVYKLQNSFTDIFTKGEYNCVSASALYAVIFSKLDIPYTIIEAPQHVYLVAYPQSHKILIETTSPEKGYYQFSDNFITQYVKSLYSSKLIGELEYKTHTANQLFDTYYFNSKGLNLKEITGLQYSNYAIYHSDDKKYHEAIFEIKKAYYLNGYERNKYLLKHSLLYYLSNNKYDKKDQVAELSVLCRFNNLSDEDVSNELIKNEFLRLTETQLINNSDYLLYEESYKMVSKEIKDTVLKNEIAFAYHYELGRLGYMNSKEESYEMPHLTEAYRIHPKNANLQSIILSYMERQLKASGDPKEIIKQINTYSKTFDFTNENSAFNSVKANCLLELSYQNFAFSNMAGGDSYLKEFETLMDAKKDTRPNESYIEKAYAFAAGVYYKKGNAAKSRQLLKTGLIYAPDNFGLKLRLKQL